MVISPFKLCFFLDDFYHPIPNPRYSGSEEPLTDISPRFQTPQDPIEQEIEYFLDKYFIEDDNSEWMPREEEEETEEEEMEDDDSPEKS